MKRCVLRALLKALVDGMARNSDGKEFHCLLAQYEKDLSPYLTELTLGATSMRESEEDLRQRLGL